MQSSYPLDVCVGQHFTLVSTVGYQNQGWRCAVVVLTVLFSEFVPFHCV